MKIIRRLVQKTQDIRQPLPPVFHRRGGTVHDARCPMRPRRRVRSAGGGRWVGSDHQATRGSSCAVGIISAIRGDDTRNSDLFHRSAVQLPKLPMLLR